MQAEDFLNWDEDELEPETEEEVFGRLVRAIANNEGAGWFFVQCNPGQVETVLARLKARFRRLSVLDLDRNSESLYPEAMALLEQENFKVLFVRGLDKVILGYEDAKRALGWDTADLHQYDLRGVPQILHHFNQMRECWRDNLQRAVVFAVPPFVVQYLLLRCPDFYDWRVGTFVLPEDEAEREQMRAWAKADNFEKYLNLSEAERLEKIRELRDAIETPGISEDDLVYFLQKQGWLFVSNQNVELALSCFNRTLKVKPNYFFAWNYRGIALSELGRNEEAVASFDKALEFQPDNPSVWTYRGIILGELGRNEEVVTSFNKALEFQPDDPSVWYFRGVALGELGRNEEAVTSFDKALEFQPDDPLAWKYRGIALNKLGRNEEAVVSYDKALEFQPDNSSAWFNRGVALNELGRNEEAVVSYDKALEFQPDNPLAWFNRGVTLSELGRNEEALTSFDHALEFQPDQYDTWHNRGIVLGQLGRSEEALASFDKALEFQPDQYDTWHNRGIVLGQLGRFWQANTSFQKAIELHPKYLEQQLLQALQETFIWAPRLIELLGIFDG